jgi:hypothetical protein
MRWFIVPRPDGCTVKPFQVGRGELDPKKPYDSSYAFVVLPKSNKAITIEEDVQSAISNPRVWKKRTKLPTIRQKQASEHRQRQEMAVGKRAL